MMTEAKIKNRLERSPVELESGKVTTVKIWLTDISVKLPNSMRYKNGDNKGKLVNHYDELLKAFHRDGTMAVLGYVNQCYNMLDDAIQNKLGNKVS